MGALGGDKKSLADLRPCQDPVSVLLVGSSDLVYVNSVTVLHLEESTKLLLLLTFNVTRMQSI